MCIRVGRLCLFFVSFRSFVTTHSFLALFNSFCLFFISLVRDYTYCHHFCGTEQSGIGMGIGIGRGGRVRSSGGRKIDVGLASLGGG